MRKRDQITLLANYELDTLIWEILQGAPQEWSIILRVDDVNGSWTEFINRVTQHSRSLIAAKNNSSGSALEHQLEKLERRLQGKVRSHLSNPNPFWFSKKPKSKDKGKRKVYSRLVGSHSSLPPPNFPPQKFSQKVKTRPSQLKPNAARPCRHCGGDHWDNECNKERKNLPTIKSHLASADADALAAEEEYNNVYSNLPDSSSEDESESEPDPDPSDSETETLEPIDEEDETSETSQSGFESPCNVLSATTSSETPLAESEESLDVLEGTIDGQVQTGMAIAHCNFIAPGLGAKPNNLPQLPTRKGMTKVYNNRAQHSVKPFTEVGPKVIMRRNMSRPPGTAWMGVQSSILQGHFYEGGDKVLVTFDSGSDITLISQKTWEDMTNKPPARVGKKIKIIQVTGNSFVNQYIILPLVFNTRLGPVEMLIEAYIVPQMSTSLILGNDWGLQYMLSLIRRHDGSYISFGETGREAEILRNSTDPILDLEGHPLQAEK
ncbi:hypothetical protein FRC12_016226, partial [Ceratobasidium sp. 428]